LLTCRLDYPAACLYGNLKTSNLNDMENNKTMKIAVVGAGVAGIVAAHLLQRRHNVSLFEKNTYVGGHTNTIVIKDGPDAGAAVDTGFIVLNDQTYPTFNRFLKQLGVKVQNSNMSFGYHCENSGLQYAGTDLNGLFAQRSNFFRPDFLRMLKDIRDFSKSAKTALRENHLNGDTLAEYVTAGGYSSGFTEHYLAPMSAAIWSTPPDKIMEFPCEPFIRFFDNHGLLSFKDRPQWQTVVGGSHAYVNEFRRLFKGDMITGADISAVERLDSGVVIRMKDGSQQNFDRVVIATHADQALRLLQDPAPEERDLLGVWQYQKNHTVLHNDASVMPSNRRAWASWNYRREQGQDEESQISVSYHMNRLQGLQIQRQYFVTLNRPVAYADDSIIYEIPYTHPVYTKAAMASQAKLPVLNGVRNTYFCGSYFGYGFHEDAVRSAVAVAKHFGIDL